MLDFYPNFIDNTNFKYINIDDKYLSTICVIRYPKKMCFMDLMNSFPKDIEYDMSIFHEKQDTVKILKDITYNISNSKAEIKTINKNQIDVDILDKLANDAKKLRYEIQINNEQIYYIYLLITIKGEDKDDILYKIKRFRSILYSKMYVSNHLNFRHLYGYLSTLPLNINDNFFSKSIYSIMTTSNIVNMFPFFTDSIYDKNGVIFGYTTYNKKICNVDIFNNKYNNSNICIFGSSGSGKSYFIKLIILRHYIRNIKQYIFDPEGEYINIALKCGGEYVNFDNNSNKHLNLLDINEIDIWQNNYLEVKVNKIYNILKSLLNIQKTHEVNVKKSIKEAYINNGINEDIGSMYITFDNEKVFLNRMLKGSSYMPTFQDVYLNLKSIINIRNREEKDLVMSFECFLNEYPFMKEKTNLDMNNSLIIYNLSKLNNNISNILFNAITDDIIERIRYENKKSIIYIDEVWKFIYNNISAEKIFMLYKTIRKLNASIVTITQDISDFFNKDLGNYGKSIINNSFIKIFFKLEYSDSEILEKIRNNKYT